MAKPVVFVIGASGSIGAATVAALSARYADKVEIRAGVRNPDKADKLKSLSHVTVVQATMGDKENLTSVLKGVDTLYINTPGIENRAQLTNATADAAKAAGVKHLVVVSLTAARLANTPFRKQFSAIEVHLEQLGVPYTILRLPYFYENLWMYKSSITGQGIITGPADPDKPFAGVVSQDAGEAGAAILVNPTAHIGKVYTIISDSFSFGDIVRSFSKAVGREIKYNQISYEEAKKEFVSADWPEWRVDGFLQFLKLIDDGAQELNPTDLSDYEAITGQKPTKLDEWVSQNAAGFQ